MTSPAVDPSPQESEVGSARWTSSPNLASVLLTVLAPATWGWGVRSVRLGAMSDSGLISVLGLPVLVGYVLLAAASVLALLQETTPKRLLALQVSMLVFMVHGLPALVEPQASYFTAYLHVGFVEEITRTGSTIPGLDARFSWPGSFGLGALVSAIGGVDSAVYFLRWAPVFFNLAYLLPLRMIVRTFIDDERVRWAALWIFVVANWVHQDYFSPQAVNLFLYLVVLAIVLRWFGLDAGKSESRLGVVRSEWALLDAERGEQHVAGEKARAFLIAALVLLLATLVISHQLTPVAALLVLTALVVVGRCRLRHLPVVLALLFAGWFAVGATAYWAGHLDTITGGAGEVGQNLGSSLLGRIVGSPARVWVLRLRIGLSVVMLGAAADGALRRWRDGSPPIAMAAIALPPFLLVAGQSYGGEVLLRSYLLALPATCTLAAVALAGSAGRERRWPWALAATVLLGALALSGVTARFGNEQFEQVGTNDLAAVRWVYANVPRGSTLIAPTRDLPWRFEQLETYRYRPEDENPLTTVTDIEQFVGRDRPAYLLTTEEEQLFGSQLYGLPPGWLDRLRGDLIDRGLVEVVFQDGDARVYEVRRDPGGNAGGGG